VLAVVKSPGRRRRTWGIFFHYRINVYWKHLKTREIYSCFDDLGSGEMRHNSDLNKDTLGAI
jgi:hypothetical protein